MTLPSNLQILLLTADECNCLHGSRGGAGYRALAHRGLTWPNANFLLTKDGIEAVAQLRKALRDRGGEAGSLQSFDDHRSPDAREQICAVEEAMEDERIAAADGDEPIPVRACHHTGESQCEDCFR